MGRGVVILCCALLAQGCTVVVSANEEQCSTADDCATRGFANATCVDQVCVAGEVDDPVWGCLGQVTEPTPDPSKSVQFPMKLVYATDESPLSTSAVVDFCDKLDVGCTGTDPGFPKGLSPDAQGMIDVSVPEGFDGFVRVTNPGDIVDSRIYVGRPVVAAPSIKEIQLLRPLEYEFLASSAGRQLDSTRGTAIVFAVDCSGIAAGGVHFETPNADTETAAYYLINQFPTMPPTATATDKDGFGGFFNMPPSAAVVRATRDADGTFIGESSFQIFADTISYVQVAPTPQ